MYVYIRNFHAEFYIFLRLSFLSFINNFSLFFLLEFLRVFIGAAVVVGLSSTSNICILYEILMEMRQRQTHNFLAHIYCSILLSCTVAVAGSALEILFSLHFGCF